MPVGDTTLPRGTQAAATGGPCSDSLPASIGWRLVMPRTWLQRLIIVSLVLPACAREASAQWPKNLSDVVLALPSTTSGKPRAKTTPPLLDAVATAPFFDQNGNPGD